MIHLITAATAQLHVFLRRYTPTNRLIAATRTRRGLKWGMPAMLLAVPYLYAAAICTTTISNGGPHWLHLLVLLFVWGALKMLWIGPVSLILLTQARRQEWKTRSRVHGNPVRAEPVRVRRT